MAYYRCYFIDDASHVYDFADFECDSDDEAVTRAHDLRPATVVEGFELWQQSRLVHCADRAERRNDAQPTPTMPPVDLSPDR